MIDIDKTAGDITKAIRNFMAAEEFSYINGYMQGIAAEIKIVASVVLIFLAISSSSFVFPLLLLLFSITLALASRISLATYISRFYIIPLFSVIVVLPLAFINGDTGMYGLLINAEGAKYVALFTVRVMAAVATVSLLLFTTRFSAILSALRRMKFPMTLITIMAMVYRYLFTFLTQLVNMLLGRRSRMVERRKSIKGASAFAGNFLSRILSKSDAVYLAMRARGFDGSVKTFDRKFEWSSAGIIYTTMVIAMVFLWAITEL
ncbi:MAG: cobalt ECF transporter T component CbiQ [Thermoplasmata archaeon]|nr:cobalt ECF transporter T component CbiQ [Thermoplasmata archaeon]